MPNWWDQQEEITPKRVEEMQRSEARLAEIAEFGPDLRASKAKAFTPAMTRRQLAPHNKFPDEIRRRVIVDRRKGDKQKHIAARYGISLTTVSRICAGG